MFSSIIKTIYWLLSSSSLFVFYLIFGTNYGQKQSLTVVSLEIISSIFAIILSGNFFYKIIFSPIMLIVWGICLTVLFHKFLPDYISQYYYEYFLVHSIPVLFLIEAVQVVRLILFFNRKKSSDFMNSRVRHFLFKLIVSVSCFGISALMFYQTLACSTLNDELLLYVYSVAGFIALSLILSLFSKKRNISDAAMISLFLSFTMNSSLKFTYQQKNCNFFQNIKIYQTHNSSDPPTVPHSESQSSFSFVDQLWQMQSDPRNFTISNLKILASQTIKDLLNEQSIKYLLPLLNYMQPLFSFALAYFAVFYIPYDLSYQKWIRNPKGILKADSIVIKETQSRKARKIAGSGFVRAASYIFITYLLSLMNWKIQPIWYIFQNILSSVLFIILFIYDTFST